MKFCIFNFVSCVVIALIMAGSVCLLCSRITTAWWAFVLVPYALIVFFIALAFFPWWTRNGKP
jgi:hypothetical protein